MAKFKVTFKDEQFDVAIEGDSANEIVSQFVKTREELEIALKSQGQVIHPRLPHEKKSKAIRPAPSPSEALDLSDLSIPNPIKNSFIERRQSQSNWDTLFFLLHYRSTGMTNKQLRRLSEELGKPISYSWFDTSFHRRDDEGLVMSKRVPGQKQVVYLLTELGKKEAEKLIHQLETPTKQVSYGK